MSMNFEDFYIGWYSRVKYFAYDYVLSEADAENITQDVFLDFYQRKEFMSQHVNIVAYLFTSVKNRCIDHLRHKLLEQEAALKLQEDFDLSFRMKFDSLEAFNVDFLSENSVIELINKALSTLPSRCREIFIMNKFDGKKQKEIADELNISIKTVETQISIAYRKLREELKNCLPLLLFLLLH